MKEFDNQIAVLGKVSALTLGRLGKGDEGHRAIPQWPWL